MQSFDEGGPVRVVQPDEEPAELLPYEKVDRTPAALQHLEGMTANFLGIDPGMLVSLLGAIEDKGSVALFGETTELAHPVFRIYRIVSFDSQTQRFTHASRFDRQHAERAYDQRREELS